LRFRYRSIRVRTFLLVLTPLVSLVGLYIYATAAAANDAIALERSTTVRNSIADPVGLFATQVQQERLAAAVLLARPSQKAAAALAAQEPTTNAALSTMRKAVAPLAGDGAPGVRSAISALLQQTAGLAALRARVVSKSVSTAAAEQAYTAVIHTGFRAIAASFQQMPNVHLVGQSSAVLRIAEAEDALLQAQVLLTADADAGSFPAADRAKFATLTGEYQGLLGEALPDLDPVYRAPFARVAGSQQAATLTALDAQVINARPGRTGVSAAAYGRTANVVTLGLALAAFSAGQKLAGALHASAGPINARLALTAGLGLAAIVASIGLSGLIGRGIVRQLAGLRGDALELARERLPQVMARLSSGQAVDVEAEAPLLPAGADEISQVRQAFNTVHRAAIEAAAGQAKLRDGVATVFRNLALRSQSLLHQQLSILDGLEQHAGGPKELEQLFRIDHLATRMRRNAEGLLVLAGDQPGRIWTDPVAMVDVLRGSVAEVVDYARIRVACSSRTALQGHAVADVIHLIAELAENATAYSPPESPVGVSGTEVVRGFAVEIEDRGLGIPADMAARLNEALSDPPPFNPAESEHLGLHIAARLAQRHGIGITLRESPYGGVTAIVLIPHGLIVSDGRHRRDQAPGTGLRAFAAGQASHDLGVAGVAATGRHASRDSPRAPAPATRAPASAHVSRQPSPAGSPASYAADAGRLARATLGTSEFQLPRRVRQANLPPHLLKSAAPRAAEPKPTDGLPAEEIRSALADIQDGMERGNRESVAALPRRVRQANLPPHLLKSAARRGAEPKPIDSLPAEEIRAMLADIQDGMERGNRENLVPGGREEPGTGPRNSLGAGPMPWAPPASERSTGDNDRQH
jgi:signal transduction histidine kinase